jgi:hypothetical protein
MIGEDPLFMTAKEAFQDISMILINDMMLQMHDDDVSMVSAPAVSTNLISTVFFIQHAVKAVAR